MVSRKPYVINRGGQLISLFHLTRVGTWSKKGQKHPYVIKEWPLMKLNSAFKKFNSSFTVFDQAYTVNPPKRLAL